MLFWEKSWSIRGKIPRDVFLPNCICHRKWHRLPRIPRFPTEVNAYFARFSGSPAENDAFFARILGFPAEHDVFFVRMLGFSMVVDVFFVRSPKFPTENDPFFARFFRISSGSFGCPAIDLAFYARICFEGFLFTVSWKLVRLSWIVVALSASLRGLSWQLGIPLRIGCPFSRQFSNGNFLSLKDLRHFSPLVSDCLPIVGSHHDSLCNLCPSTCYAACIISLGSFRPDLWDNWNVGHIFVQSPWLPVVVVVLVQPGSR